MLTEQKEHVKFIENQLTSCSEFCEKTVTIDRTRHLLTYKIWIVNKVNELTKLVEYTSLEPQCKANDINFKLCEPVELFNIQ